MVLWLTHTALAILPCCGIVTRTVTRRNGWSQASPHRGGRSHVSWDYGLKKSKGSRVALPAEGICMSCQHIRSYITCLGGQGKHHTTVEGGRPRAFFSISVNATEPFKSHFTALHCHLHMANKKANSNTLLYFQYRTFFHAKNIIYNKLVQFLSS